MPRKSVKKVKLIPSIQTSSSLPKMSIAERILYIIWLLFKWAFVFSSETCINPLTWLIAMVLRGLIFYFILSPYQDAILKYFTLADGHSSIFCIPVGLFLLWYFFTSLLMLLGAIYSGFGRINTSNEAKYSEFGKLADYANNKMKFQSYQDSIDMLTGRKNKK